MMNLNACCKLIDLFFLLFVIAFRLHLIKNNNIFEKVIEFLIKIDTFFKKSLKFILYFVKKNVEYR